MNNSMRYLMLGLGLMSLVGCSSTVRTVLVSQNPPLACLIECPEYPTAPPMVEDLDEWLKWGDDVSADYQYCAQLHNSCATESMRRAEDTPSGVLGE